MLVIDIVWQAVDKNQFVPGIASWQGRDAPDFVPLVTSSHLSWTIEGPRRCIGSRDPSGHSIQCPEQSIVPANGLRCGPCTAMDQLDPCIRCKGADCKASESRRKRCQSSQYAVYIAVFKDQTLKVGVSTLGRVKTRWLEQGADFAGIISTANNGLEARRIEESLGHLAGATKQVSGQRKVSGITQHLDSSTAFNLAQSFLKSNNVTPLDSEFTLEDLSPYYGLSGVDAMPRSWRFSPESRNTQHLVGDVCGVKGSLLVTSTGSSFTVTNLKQLIGYTITLNPDATMIAQAGLLDFL